MSNRTRGRVTGSPARPGPRPARRTSTSRRRRTARPARPRSSPRRRGGRGRSGPARRALNAAGSSSPRIASRSPSASTAAASRLRKPWRSPLRIGWCSPAVALNGTPASRHAATNAATSSTVGSVVPPQRILAPAPASRTAATAPRRPRPGESSQNARTPGSFSFDQRLGVRDPLGIDPRLDELDVVRRCSDRVEVTLAAVEHDAQPRRVGRQLVQLRGRDDEAVEHPGVLARARPPVGLDGGGHVHRRGREQRGVVDQAAEQLAACVAHAGGIALRLAGHSRALQA